MKLLLIKLNKIKVLNKTGNKCVSKDGHGSEKHYPTIHH